MLTPGDEGCASGWKRSRKLLSALRCLTVTDMGPTVQSRRPDGGSEGSEGFEGSLIAGDDDEAGSCCSGIDCTDGFNAVPPLELVGWRN